MIFLFQLYLLALLIIFVGNYIVAYDNSDTFSTIFISIDPDTGIITHLGNLTRRQVYDFKIKQGTYITASFDGVDRFTNISEPELVSYQILLCNILYLLLIDYIKDQHALIV